MSQVNPELLARFEELTGEVVECSRRLKAAVLRHRRSSRHGPPAIPVDEQGRSYFGLRSEHLLLIHRMVREHPELLDEYRKWRVLYPSLIESEVNEPS